jgi:hypothetical protein
MKTDAIPDAIRVAFFTALLVSGAAATAELAVLDAIDACEDVMHPTFIAETVRSAIRRRTELPSRGDALELLPPQLRYILTLRWRLRDCFVLRILVGLSPQVCAGLLEIAIPEFHDALYEALSELAHVCPAGA